MEHLNAQKGLKKLYTAQVLNLVATALAVTVILAIPAAIIVLVGGIFALIAYINCAKDDDGYKIALYLTIGSIVVALLSSLLGVVGDILSLGITLATAWFMIMTTVRLLEEKGLHDIAQLGRNTWKTYLVMQAIAGVVQILTDLLSAAKILSILLGIVNLVFSIIAAVSYMKFIKASYPVV